MRQSRKVQMAVEDTPVWKPRHFVTFLVKRTVYISFYLLTYLQKEELF